MTPAPSVSVVVCTRNRGTAINQTIETLLSNSEPGLEILCVDQSDDDVTANALAEWADPRIEYHRTRTRGLSIARNIGLELARADLVLMTDDDCEVPSDWVARMTREMRAHPELALLYCDVLVGPCDENEGFIPGCKVQSVVFTDIMRATEGLGIGAGFALRKGPAVKAGGFDPCLGAGASFKSGEEHDLSYRLLLHGFSVGCTDETHVIHHGFRTHAQGKQLVKGYMVGYGAVFAKLTKCGHWSAIPAYGKAVWINAARPLLEGLVAGKRPLGVRRLGYFLYGFARGLSTPVDREQEVFVAPSASVT